MLRHSLRAVALMLATAAAADDLPPPQVSGVPIPEGQVAAAVSGVDGLVADIMARTGVPGVAVAVVAPQALLTKGYGVRETGKPGAIDPDTVFQLASVSKSVGATVVATQVTAGKVGWDSRMGDLLPWFRLKEPAVSAMLTVGDLYSHRSGLPDHAGDDLEDLGFDRRAILERLGLLPLAPFRDSYAYTNFGLTAGAMAVAAAAGTDWDTLSEETVYGPLGMTRTSSRFDDYIHRDNRAVPHVRLDGRWVARYQRQPDAQTPAGGVSSSAADMARWMQLVLGDGTVAGERLIDPAALLPALSPQSVSAPPATPDSRAGFYGFGFGVDVTPAGRVRLNHSGAFALGAATTFMMLPSAGVGITVLTNGAPVGAPEAIAFGFLDLVQFGRVTRDWYTVLAPLFEGMSAPFGTLAGKEPPADPAPSMPLETYAGSYDNPYYGPLTVRVGDAGLVLGAGPAGTHWPLQHWDGNTFFFEPGGENAEPGSRSAVTFNPGRSAVTVEFWDEAGLGTFLR